MLPHLPDWRWLLDRADSPWYPSVRLFRQDETRDYAGVVDTVRTELLAMASAFAALTTLRMTSCVDSLKISARARFRLLWRVATGYSATTEEHAPTKALSMMVADERVVE